MRREDPRVLKIGRLAERSGVSVRALRYYEEQGLLRAERTPAGQRVYQESDVERVRFYQQLYAAGLTSRNIVQLLPCIKSGHTNAEQRAMLREQRDRIQAKADELADVLERLDGLIAMTRTPPAEPQSTRSGA
ncbi:DNA-binding transcriptional regulator, MerR family [Amycolatopsis marina]|uniref:DNA-binding transcriptional regulator, MerR family n=1 Tax=Amycolatopsis marina TaxID=490629 RepID=A0A1I1BX09_9PSEU|nr:MerR family transcriptional regulator [Amycolatopsis marina]SFB53020.1 DNA-binding transcriptional regulator, MerR family [Amycolatopsis marina]